MIISLIGFMATGKTAVGKRLSKRLEYPFIDLDSYLEEKNNLKVSEIFELKGEKFFRKQENSSLKEILIKYNNLVLSPGGGIILEQKNIELLKEKTVPFLLKASPQTIMDRIEDLKKRPLLNNEKPVSVIKKLLKQREKYYNQFEYVIKTDGKNLDEVVDDIIIKLKKINLDHEIQN